jgi:hypothetical protein
LVNGPRNVSDFLELFWQALRTDVFQFNTARPNVEGEMTAIGTFRT